MSHPVQRARARAQRLETPEGLRRNLGSPPLFAIVQAFVAASVYFALGLIAQRAQGWTWVVLLVGAVFFVLLLLSYVEGASLHQERGGATILARYAFNELWSFVAGWAILLDYILLIAITAFVASSYAGALWSVLDTGVVRFLVAVLVIGVTAAMNLRGGGKRRYELAVLWVMADLALQAVIVVLGLALLFDRDALTHPATFGATPTATDVLFAFTLGLVAFAGIDASSGLAGDVHIGRRGLRRLLMLRVLTLVPYVGLGLIAVLALPLAQLTPESEVVERPMMGVVDALDHGVLSDVLRPVVAVMALGILTFACNAAMLGLARLGYSLALNRQIPASLGRLHAEFHTPWVVITIGSVLGVALLVPADLEFLAGLSAFGATLAFSVVHLSVIRLRIREPGRDRPYRMPFNLRVGEIDWPLPALLGFLLSLAAFGSVLALHGGARAVGLAWLGGGLLLFVGSRVSAGKPLTGRVTVPEASLTGEQARKVEYGSILVPIFGTPLDDDIMQTAGRLAAEEGEDEGEGGAVIEALWVFAIPMSLPIDAPVPEAQLKRARTALQRAKRVGEEYAGVEVATATTRARRAGEGIVFEAERRGVEVIVLAAEEPTGVRGGPLLGGKEGLRDTYVGETTKYVVTKAPCRVLLTAPPAHKPPADPFAQFDAAYAEPPSTDGGDPAAARR